MTAPYLTQRLRLSVDPNGSTGIDTQPANWDRVDYASGTLATVKGVNIPNSQLYDGAIVVETDTGISWRCVSDGSGGFTKKYISYPLFYIASYNAGFNNGGRLWGWDNVYTDPNSSVNSEGMRVPGTNYAKIPVKGLYTGIITARFSDSNFGFRDLVLAINGSNMSGDYWQRLQASPIFTTNLKIRIDRIYNAGDEIGMYVSQNSGGDLTLTSAIFLQMVRPI
jgi:hypothetical protein